MGATTKTNMAAFVSRALRLPLKVKSHPTSVRSLRTSAALNGGLWNKDWRPEDLPEDKPEFTEEEMKASAKKYGLTPEDYKVLPDMGDYPDVPIVSDEIKSDYYDYDDPTFKRSFGEPMHLYADLHFGDRPASEWYTQYKFSSAAMHSFLIAVMIVWALFSCNQRRNPSVKYPRCMKEYPYHRLQNKYNVTVREVKKQEHYAF